MYYLDSCHHEVTDVKIQNTCQSTLLRKTTLTEDATIFYGDSCHFQVTDVKFHYL